MAGSETAGGKIVGKGGLMATGLDWKVKLCDRKKKQGIYLRYIHTSCEKGKAARGTHPLGRQI